MNKVGEAVSKKFDEGLTKLEERFQIPSSHLKENNNDGLLSEV